MGYPHKESRMFARVVTFEGPAERLAEGAEQRFRSQVLPTLQQQAGFQGALVLLDRANGRLLGLTLWDTAEHLQAAGRAMNPTRDASAAEMGAGPATADDYEVVARV
jgi:hypothetical protein